MDDLGLQHKCAKCRALVSDAAKETHEQAKGHAFVSLASVREDLIRLIDLLLA